MKNEWENIAKEADEIQDTKNKVLNPVLTDLIKKYAKGNTLFDYGSGWGEFADLMRKEGFSVTAFDAAPEMVEQAKDKFSGPTFLSKSEFQEALPELKEEFDVVTSNLVLCILTREQHGEMISTMVSLAKDDGVIIISFCHPKYDYLPDSLVTNRFVPEGATYESEFIFEKEVKENGVRFHDHHRPLEYYTKLFEEHSLETLEVAESNVLGTVHQPDFIIFALKKQ